jgi:hypothetical protein
MRYSRGEQYTYFSWIQAWVGARLGSKTACGGNVVPIRPRISCVRRYAINTAKEEVNALLDNLPEDCSLEDIQYHLYVVEKINRGIELADKEGTLSQDEVERKFDKWLSE